MSSGRDAGGCALNVASRGFVTMLSQDVQGMLGRFHMLECMQDGGCLLRYYDHGPRGEKSPVIPYAPMDRFRLYTGTRETGSFNHHSQIAKFKGKYFFAWSNGLVDEEAEGQRILVSSSDDGCRWCDPVVVAGDKNDKGVAHNCVAMKATEDKLFIVGMSEETTIDASVVGMRRVDPESYQLCAHVSCDGKTWEKAYTFDDQFRWIFEAPRATADGHLMCVAAIKEGAAVLRWAGEDLCTDPEIITVPQPFGAVFPYGEASWYQTDDDTIVVFWRDEGRSCRLWVNYSTDNGKTFSEPMISDIPDSMSRNYAGRLADGRFYLCNNAFPTLLNRMHLMLLLSDDGYTFNKCYMLADDPTSQRLTGLLKEDGYQYPCCLVDGDRLFVAYSVNKEDIECGIVDVTKI